MNSISPSPSSDHRCAVAPTHGVLVRAFLLFRPPGFCCGTTLAALPPPPQRRMQEDSRRYQEEIIADMERRRNACKQLSRVWDRQKNLNMLTKQVASLY